jgi:tripartite-type tricarboxylate transporter receptor subunit TctC
VLVPANTPKDVAQFIYQEVVKATKSPEVTAKMEQLGLEIICNTPEQFTQQIKTEIAKWGKVIKEANIKAQ